ncbi:MAG: hypothetical protein R6X12_04250 [bacterium]
MTRLPPPRFVAVSSEVGRGHPRYLDSVLEALRREGVADIPRVVPRWRLAHLGYRLGARGGLLTALYDRFRSGRPSRMLLSLLDEGLRRRLRGCGATVLVDHPLLAHLLGPVCRVGYVHGEIAAPPSAAVATAWRTFVPLPETADRLAAAGAGRETLVLTGLITEPGLADTADAAFAARLRRLESDAPLTVGFFTSGACPRPHLRRIIAGACSCLDAGLNATVFCGTAPRVADRLGRALGNRPGLRLLSTRTRQEDTARAVERFPELDVMVAAAHERTNWAVGLGLPMFLLEPDIGPFAPLNREFALRAGVARSLGGAAGAAALGATLAGLRSAGGLRTMAEAGRGRHPVAGAAAAARFLLAG